MSELRIRVSSLHPRVCYTCKTVFDRFLGVPVLCVDDSEDYHIDYRQNPSPDHPSIACDGLLYGEENVPTGGDDPLSAIFRKLCQWESYKHPKLDQHGRHVEQEPGLELHFELRKLRQWLIEHLPGSPLRNPAFTWEITIDIDQPWKHQNKTLPVRLGGFFKDLLRGDVQGIKERIKLQDPFDTLESVRSHCPPEKTTAFILAGRHHPLDSRFDLSMPAYQDYVKKWKNAGFEIGLHPSYLSSENAEILNSDFDLLHSVVGSFRKSRQHYLRYALPDTFRQLEQLGIEQDYSLCPHEALGGRTGIAMPYSWYDLQAERESKLTLVPAVVMDRTLQQYLKLGPAAAFGKTAAVIDVLRELGGHFVLILHNETFSESGEWKGWTRWIESTIRYLQANGR